MKKYIIAFIVLFAAAGISLGFFLNAKKKNDKETKQEQEKIASFQLFSFDSSAIDKIDICNSEGNFTVELIDGSWKITEGGDFVPDQDYITLMCSYFSTLTASGSHSGNPEEYELDNEHASTVTFSGSGNSYTVTIGGVSPTQEYYYVMIDGRTDIYSVESVYNSGSNFSTEKMMLKSKNLVLYDDDEFAHITIKKKGNIICDLDYDEESGAWILPDEYADFQFDVTAVTSMINVLTRLQAEQMLDEDLTDLSKYGFDDPYAEVTLTGKDGTQRNLLAGDFSADNRYANFLVYDNGDISRNQVEVYYKSDVDFVDYTPINFISTTVYNPSMYNISGVKVAYDDEEFEFTMDQEQKKCLYNGQNIQIAVETVLTAFTNYYNSFSVYTVKKIDMDAEPELKDPLLTVEYELLDGTIYTYQLTDAGDQKCYVFSNGEYTGEVVDDSCLVGYTSVQNYFDILKSTANIE